MNFQRIDPPIRLRGIIECYWIAESDNTEPRIQKIIPDGFPELVFHFGDPYRIKLRENWETQQRSLMAGQITGHFYLQNTGRSSILGLKFRPAALACLFDISMNTITDEVVELDFRREHFRVLDTGIRKVENFENRLKFVNEYLASLPFNGDRAIDHAVNLIFETNGAISVNALCEKVAVGERKLERLFNKFVGLSPKFYARVIRFGHIFKNATTTKQNWTELGLEAGFYDQSHFIKNFKAFTGEDPSSYFFEDDNMANFFLKK